MKLLIITIFLTLTSLTHAIQIKEVVRVYDGDTIYVNLDCVFEIFCKNIGIRLKGIDAPEIRSRNKKEKALGIEARDYLKEVIDNSTYIELTDYRRGKYFRIVGDVMVNGLSLSEIMISSGYARYYKGGKRNKWK